MANDRSAWRRGDLRIIIQAAFRPVNHIYAALRVDVPLNHMRAPAGGFAEAAGLFTSKCFEAHSFWTIMEQIGGECPPGRNRHEADKLAEKLHTE